MVDEQQRMVAVIGTCTDVMERDEAPQDRERLIDALMKSNATLERLAYVVAHDLKAPLRGIRNLSAWNEEDLGDGDNERIHEDLALHLVANTIKHADRDEAHVVVACARENDSLRLSTRDDGPGISAESQSRSWRSSYPDIEAKTADTHGSSVTIVKRILDARGGRAWVESNDREGATFHVYWPL